MPSDVLITPASSKIDFTDGSNSTKRLNISGTAFNFNSNLNVLSSTSLGSAFKAEGVNGTLFEVIDDLSNSLMSVNTIGGLPVFEVFANNSVIAGQYGANDFVISGNKVGIGLANPINKLSVSGAVSIGSSYNVAAPSNGLIVQGDVGIGVTSFNYSSANRANLEMYGSGESLLALRNSTGNSYIQKSGADFYINNITNGFIAINNNGSERWRITSAGVLQSNADQTIQTSTGVLTIATAAGNGHIILSPHGTGNVGIGTASPLTKLDVRSGSITAGTNSSTAGTTIIAGYYTAGALTVLGTEQSSGGPVLGYAVTPSTSGTGAFLSATSIAIPRSAYTQDGGTHRWYIGASQTVAIGSAVTTSEVMRINSSGSVGIGVISNLQPLSVGTSSANTFGLLRTGVSAVAGNTGPSINFYLSQSATTSLTGDANLARILANPIDGWGGYLQFFTKQNDGVPGNSPVVRMTIDTAGNVGIGTITPNAKVESYFSSNALTFNYLATNFNNNSPIPTYSFDVTGGAETRSIKAGIGYERHLTNGRGAMHFYNDSVNDTSNITGSRSSIGDIKMTIQNDGNVGIGVVLPSYKLDVNGTTRFGGIVYNEAVQIDDFNYFNLQPYIESETLSSILSISGTAPTFTTLTNTTAPFSKVLSVSAYGEAAMSELIPVQAGETIYGEIWTYRATGAAGTAGVIYCGVQRFDKDKKMIDANAGLNTAPSGYFIASNQTIPSNSTWTKYSGTLVLPTSHTPYNTSDGGPVRYIRPYIIYNYTSGTILTYIGGWKIRKVQLTRDSGPVAINGSVAIGSNSVNYGRLQISATTTSPSLSATNPTDPSLIISNSDIAYGTMFATYGDGKGALQQRRTDAATYYDFSLQPHGGNVGIGTLSPTSKLDVTGGNIELDPNQFISFNNAGTVPKIGYRTSGPQAGLDLYDNAGLLTISLGNQAVGIGDYAGGIALPSKGLAVSGNVGIGTTNPSSSLHVSKVGNSAGGTILMGLSNDGAAKWSYLVSTQYNSSSNAKGFSLIGGYTDASSNVVAIGGSIYEANPATELQFYTHTAVTHATGGTRRMTINTNGNVGIGYTNPAYLLDVNGVARINGNFNITGGGDLGIFDSDGTGTFYSYMDAGVGYIRIDDGSSANGKLDINNSLLYIQQAGGNVGVGTNNPTSKLHVWNGTVRVSGFQSIAAGPLTFLRSDYNGSAAVQINFLNINPSNGYDSDLGIQLMNTAGSMVDVMRIKGSTGNVGIGVINPLAQLHINEAISGAAALRVDGTNGTLFSVVDDLSDSLMSVNNSAGLPVLEVFADDRIVAGQYGANDLVVRNNRVGIGTNNPTNKLHVYASAAGSTVASNAIAVFEQSSNAGIQVCVPDASEAGLFFSRSGAAYYSAITRNGTDLLLKNNSATAVTINSSGNVGINTANPTTKLYVTGSITALDGTFISNVTSGADKYFLNCYGTSTNQMFALYENSSNVYLNSYSTMALRANQNGGSGGFITLTGGNVGVGGNPSARLHVIDNNASPATGNLLVSSTGGNASIRIDSNSTSNYTYFTLSQGGAGKFELGIVPTSSDFYINPTVQSGANGAAIYVKKADGNVGINSTSPNSPLTVYNNSDVWHFRLGGASGELRMGGQTNSGAVIQAYTPGGAFRDLYLQRDGGNVGITTNSPNAKLHIIGATNTDAGVRGGTVHIRDSTASASPATAGMSGIVFSSSPGTDWAIGKYWSGTTSRFVIKDAGSALGTNLLSIDANGNVGIGIDSPTAKLQVGTNSTAALADNSPIARFGGSGSGSRVYGLTLANTASAAVSNDSSLSFIVAGNYSATGIISAVLRSTVTAATDLVFTNYNNALFERMRIQFDGNVGIGTSLPAALLQIGGLTPTSATGGIQFGDDTGTRLYRSASGIITCSGTIAATFSGNLTGNVTGNVSGTAGGETFATVTGRGASTTTQISVGTAAGGSMYTGIKSGAGYSDAVSGATFKSITDHPTGGSYAFAAYFNGAPGTGTNSFFVAADGSGYFKSLLTTGSISTGAITSAVIKGDAGADYPHSFTNTDSGNTHWTNRSGRLLTSNGAGWQTDGRDPIMALVTSGNTNNTNIANSIGLALHNESQTNNTFSPAITFSNLSNSGSYNTTYAAIIGRKTGQGVDSNWSAGELHFYTMPVGGYVNNIPSLLINSAGNVGIGTTTPAALLQIGNGSPTAATGGIQFGDDTGARIYRSGASTIACSGTIAATFSGNLTGNATNVTGTVAIANGGTGTTTAQLAINALAGAVTNAQYLRGNGTNVVMSAIQASDVPTLNQNTTGSSGSCTGNAANVTGTVALANGGSGQTSAQAAMNAFAGAVTSGSYLRGNGTNVVMSTIQAADVPTLNQNTTGSSTFVASLGVLNYDNDRTTKRAGLSHYTGYSTGTNRPTTYDYTLQVTNGTSGWEISMDWIATTGPAIYARSLRDCCQNWSSWVRILDSANYSFAANMNQNVRTTDGVTFAGITGNGQLNINHSTPTAVARLWSGGSTVWSLGVGDASGSYFNISADFGSFTINKTNGYVGIGTTSQTTRLQLGSGTPTASADGIQFGDDTGARLYRSSSGVVSASNSFAAAGGYVYASNYLQTGNNLIYPASFSATQRLEVGNAAQNAWIDGITIAPGGNVTVAGTLTESSSIRYKENIETISAPILPKLNQIRPVTYNKKDNPNNIEYGIIAEELNELFPEFVNKNESGEIESVNYSRLTVILIKAVKELQEEVEKLKNK